MKTLIELYDERPIENVLGSEVFKPERTIFLCTSEVAACKRTREALQKYFRHRGLNTELIFMEASLYESDKIANQLRKITGTYPDCVMDITGGTDAALFACGIVCAESNIPAFTYSRKRNAFFCIHNKPFQDPMTCDLKHTVEDCFIMAGGALRTGRVNNSVLYKYKSKFDMFFQLYLRHRTDWQKAVNYIQLASQVEKDRPIPLEVSCGYTLKGDHGSRIDAPVSLLYELEDLGYLKDVSVSHKTVAFRFADRQIRSWLRDIGSVLELYVYKACLDSELFNDVRTSAVVDWESNFQRDGVTNEIDVMAMDGIFPVFISCKTCPIDTKALNELAVLRDRFGGKGAAAAIVTTQRCRNVTRHRASELDIDVIDLDDLKAGKIKEHIKALTKR